VVQRSLPRLGLRFSWLVRDHRLALLWQNLAISWRNWIPESGFQ
jgi:hypothetical protein